MEVDLAVVADAANVSREGKLNILGVFDTIWAREFPFRHSAMVFVLRVRAERSEQGDHRLELRLADDAGGEVFKTEGPLRVPGGLPGRPVKPHVIMGLNGVSFSKDGDYRFDVVVDGQRLRSVPLYVMRTPPVPPAGQIA